MGVSEGMESEDNKDGGLGIGGLRKTSKLQCRQLQNIMLSCSLSSCTLAT